MDKMGLVYQMIAVLMVLMEHTVAQRLFMKSELNVKVFQGKNCDKHTQDTGKRYYRYLMISEMNEGWLYVGAMNTLYKVAISDMSCLKYNDSMVPEFDTSRRCRIQGKLDVPDCQNNIRVIMEMGGSLFVCGTGAYSPKKYTLNDNLEINETSSGVAICPFDPLDNYTAILVRDGNPGNSTVPYFGTYTDFIKSSPVFYRPKFVGKDDGISYLEKATDREDIGWLNSPQFVGSFDVDSSDGTGTVMFFFRETAIEYQASRNKIYSRVGKVCKRDLGGGMMEVAKKKWLSFQKARLVCSLSGNSPYYFDDIYDVYQSGDQFYALFYNQGELNSSAICVYDKLAIEDAFLGKFQYRTQTGVWSVLPDHLNPSPRLDNCTAHRDIPEIVQKNVSRYQLMYQTVSPLYGRPIFYKSGVQLINIVVDQTKSNTKNGDRSRNIYAASSEGEVYDIFMKTFDPSTSPSIPFLTVLNSIYRPFGTDISPDYAVWDMKLLNNDIIMGTDYEVTKLQLTDICARIYHVDVCICNTRCKWNSCSDKCVSVIEQNCSNASETKDWEVVTTAGVMNAVKDLIQPNNEVVTLNAVGLGLYFTIPLITIVKTEEIIWVKSTEAIRDCSIGEHLESPEKYALSSSGDLVVKNLTLADTARYVACNRNHRDIGLSVYHVQIQSETSDVINVWKQQFNEWSSAFIKWRDCADTFVDSCNSNP